MYNPSKVFVYLTGLRYGLSDGQDKFEDKNGEERTWATENGAISFLRNSKYAWVVTKLDGKVLYLNCLDPEAEAERQTWGPHYWEKSNMVTIMDHGGGRSYDLAKCKYCGLEEKRYGFERWLESGHCPNNKPTIDGPEEVKMSEEVVVTHAPAKCTTCGGPLPFVEYGHKLGKNGKEATWPIYEKCKNPECKTGAKNLQHEGQIVVPKVKKEKPVKVVAAEPVAPASEPAPVTVEAVIPAIPAEAGVVADPKMLESAVDRANRVIGIADRTMYRFYQLSVGHEIEELVAICEAYGPGAVHMVEVDMEHMAGLTVDFSKPHIEKFENDFRLVISPEQYYKLEIIKGLTAGYRYVAAVANKKLDTEAASG
jgi:hypothetical protein